MDEIKHQFTPQGALWRSTIKQLYEYQWIKQLWSTVKEDIIVKSFKKWSKSNPLDGNEDNLTYEEDDDDEEEEEKKRVQMTISRDFKGQLDFVN